MLFNSIEFLLFLAIVLVAYYKFDHRNQNFWLLLSSYVFYGWWDWRFLLLIFSSTAVDYIVSNTLENTKSSKRRKNLLYCSIFFNLGLLATFKYFNFFIDSFIDLGMLIGLNMDTPALRLLPPVGISFYTFQTMSYTIEVYRRKSRPEKDFFAFALFVSYFPQLVAGPIERANRLLPQLKKKRTIHVDDIKSGLLLILVGLFKKVAIADTAGMQVDTIYSNPAQQSSLTLLAAAILFMLQIYGDFSGYSNMARGISRLLGIHLIENFKTPYFSKNISEFWKRWHISLSQWLRDYLYIPLGGNKRSNGATRRNLMITMLLGGLWHGAAWTFVIWGFINGLYLVIHRIWSQQLEKARERGQLDRLTGTLWLRTVNHLLSIAITMIAVMVAFVFFRADSLTHAWQILYGIVDVRGPFNIGDTLLPCLLVLLLTPIEIIQYRNNDRLLALRDLPLTLRSLIYSGMCLSLILASQHDRPFIYFQF